MSSSTVDSSLSLQWSKARQADGLRAYRVLLGCNLALQLLVGLAALLLPAWVAGSSEVLDPLRESWTRGCGAMLLLVTALYVPGWLDPIHQREANIIGILGRIWMGSVWVSWGGGFLLGLAVFDYIWAAILASFYLRLFRAVIMSRP